MGSERGAQRYCLCGTRLALDNPGPQCAQCQRASRDKLIAPPEVPAGFWETDQLRDAFAARHMGRVARAYREHPCHRPVYGQGGISQRLLGEWLGLSQGHVSRIENGPPIRNLDTLAYWARVLRIPAHLLWFKPAGQEPAQCEEAGNPAWKESPAAIEEAEDVDRHEFLLLAGSTLGGLLAPPLVHTWHDRRHELALPDLSDALLDRIRAQTEGFRWLDRKDGARKHLRAATQHARSLTHFWRLTEDSHPLRTPLAEVAADACHLVAYQAFDQGQRTHAMEWYRSSAELAARAGSQDLYVFAVSGVAFIHAKNGDAELALAVLHQLSPLRQSAAAGCYIAVYEAQAYASAKRLDLALRALDRAGAYAEHTRNEAPSSWLGIQDSSFVERQRAILLAQFGASEALVLLQQLDQSTPAVFRRYRVAIATDRALTYANSEEVEPSAASLTSALLLNQETRSVEKTKQILRVRALLDPFQDSQAIQAVDEVIQATKAREFALRRSFTAPGHPEPTVS